MIHRSKPSNRNERVRLTRFYEPYHQIRLSFQHMLNFLDFLSPVVRAGLNESEAPGKVLTTRPNKHLEQLRSVSHALVSTLQMQRSKTSKLIRFGSLHFRDNWGWPCTAVCMWLICSNRKLYHKTTIFLLQWHYTIFFVIDSLTIFTAQIVHSYMYWGKIRLHSLADQNVHLLENTFSMKISRKSNWSRTTWLSFAMGALQ